MWRTVKHHSIKAPDPGFQSSKLDLSGTIVNSSPVSWRSSECTFSLCSTGFFLLVPHQEENCTTVIHDILVETLTLTCIWKVSLLLFIFGAPMSILNINSSERHYYFFINFWETSFLLFIHLRDVNTDNYGTMPSNYAFLENTFYIKFLFTYISPLFKYEQQPLINNTSSQQQQHPHSTQYSLINIVP